MTFAIAALCVVGLAWVAAGTTPNQGDPQSHPSTKTYTIPAPILTTSSGDAPRPLSMPVAGIDPSTIHDNFNEMRGGDTRRHDALDILAPRGTNVVATDDGTVKKLFTSVPGGLTVYEFDPDQRYCYYYAHLDAYAPGLHEGQILHRGDLIGYVGTTGNAPKDTPHLHFAVIRLDPDRRWWTGTAIDPYPLLYKRR
ncbi:MAG TPA: M23 family metallopeptidase [Thermoanaerobaculia bacterium]|nr:M23 family metallopeptidase [Thermoanaerobaculia bacterium]